jgi:hypothetical protein
MNRRSRLVILFFLSALAPSFVGKSASQTKLGALHLSIALDKTHFASPEPVRVRVTVANNTGDTINTKTIPVSFYLSRYGTDLAKCRFPDCFIAGTYWAKQFANRESQNLEVNLTDLYWNELLSSQIDLRRPKNFYEKLPLGKYSLFMEFLFPDPKSTRRDPRTISVTSNAVDITIAR